MMKEIQLVTRRSGFQLRMGVTPTEGEDKCLECIGLKCNSCRPIYVMSGERISAPMGRLMTKRQGR